VPDTESVGEEIRMGRSCGWPQRTSHRLNPHRIRETRPGSIYESGREKIYSARAFPEKRKI